MNALQMSMESAHTPLFDTASVRRVRNTTMKSEQASGITSKPAIEDHFKTGQRTITLDELVLPYRLAVWQVQFDPVRSLIVSPEMPAVIPARRSAGPYSSPPLPASEGEL